MEGLSGRGQTLVEATLALMLIVSLLAGVIKILHPTMAYMREHPKILERRSVLP
jgi:hypothetical protein